MNQKTKGWLAIAIGALILLTEWQQWNGNVHYLWGALVIIWGGMALK